MSVMNSINELKTAKQMQKALKKDPNDIEALLQLASMLGTLKTPDLDQKRKVLNRILALEPTNPAARQMLFEMDRAEIGGDAARLSAAVILTPQAAIDLAESPIRLRYSIFHQILFYPVLAFYILLMFLSYGEWVVFSTLLVLFPILLIPVWFLSAVLDVSTAGLHLSRLFGVYRRELEWNEIERVDPGPMGVGMKLTARDGRSLMISSQLYGYSSFVEILRHTRPNLFEVTAEKTFKKGFLAKYGWFFFLVPATPMALGAIVVPPFVTGILVTVMVFFLWKRALQAAHLVSVDGNRLLARSFTRSREITVQQIEDLRLATTYNRRGVTKTVIRISVRDQDDLTLSGFPEGIEIVYGFLKNWWDAQRSA